MLTLLKNNAVQLDVTSANMDLSINRARAMLQSSVNLQFVSASVNSGVLEARIKLQNNSGHKTPTGYPSRRMWLNFKVTDSNNNVVFESGRINADGSIVGADSDTDNTVYEPHYELITSADQVQIYEPVMGNSDGNLTYTLLRGAQYLKDNRLTPQGFDKLAVPSDVAVRGMAFNDVDFNQGSDEITYRIPAAVSLGRSGEDCPGQDPPGRFPDRFRAPGVGPAEIPGIHSHHNPGQVPWSQGRSSAGYV